MNRSVHWMLDIVYALSYIKINMKTISQRTNTIKVKPLSDDVKMCTYESHEGERLLSRSEFYGRSTVCKVCSIKKKQESRRRERLVKMETTYNQYPFILENRELLSQSKRLFKPGFISEVSVIKRILETGNTFKYNPTFEEFIPLPPTIIESITHSSVKNYWFVSAASDALSVCRYLLYPTNTCDKRHIVLYGDISHTHLSFIANASVNYHFDLELINEKSVRFE